MQRPHQSQSSFEMRKSSLSSSESLLTCACSVFAWREPLALVNLELAPVTLVSGVAEALVARDLVLALAVEAGLLRAFVDVH